MLRCLGMAKKKERLETTGPNGRKLELNFAHARRTWQISTIFAPVHNTGLLLSGMVARR